jgi:cell division protease FtsH
MKWMEFRIRGEYIEYWTQIVNLLLEQLAAIEERAGVVVVAATNHPDRIDPAVKRAGRLDREIQIEKPDTRALVEIFRFYLGSETLKDADLVPLAMASRGATGADVEAMVRRAKGTARRARRELTIDDLLAVRNGDVPALSPEARWRIAVHEAGHAVAAIALEAGHVGGISIHPAGGFVEIRSDISGSSTYERLLRELAVFMAGRAAERLILGDVGAGAGMARESDLGRATALALLIETQCGLGHSGEAYLGEIKDLVYAPSLHLAVNQQLKDAEAKASLTLDRTRGRLEALANALNREGYLSGDEIRSIVCVTPIDMNEAEEEFA